LASLRSFFKFLCREGYLKTNPASALLTPKLDKKLPLFLSEEEVVALIESVSVSDLWGRRDRAILETLYSTGMRVSELVSLNTEDIDFIGSVTKVSGKGRKERMLPIGEKALTSIRHYLEALPEGQKEKSKAEKEGLWKKVKEKIQAIENKAKKNPIENVQQIEALKIIRNEVDALKKLLREIYG